MDSRIEDYIRRGKFYVDGWLRTEAARIVVAPNKRQRSFGVAGGIAAESPVWRRLRTTPVRLPLRWAWHTGRTLRRGLRRNEDF
jgi:hypothetical protein